MVKQSTTTTTTTKTTHILRSPYPDPAWPAISLEMEARILDVLLPLLNPIGEYRKKSGPPSKGNNRKRRRRTEVQDTDKNVSGELPASAPEILHHLTIGFNSTVRKLESFIADGRAAKEPELHQDRNRPQSLAIFVCFSTLPPMLIGPLPLLAATVTASTTSTTDVRLVPISQTNALRIAKALNQPRANLVSVSGPVCDTEELHELIRANVGSITIPWIQPPALATYKPLNVQVENVAIGDSSGSGRRKRTAEKIS